VPPLGNVAVGRSRLFARHDFRRNRKPFVHGSENQPVVPPETFPAPHWMQQEKREDKTFRQGTPARAEAYFATTIAATVRRYQGAIGGVVHMLDLGKSYDEGLID
jgi:hypothetical protein